MPVDSGTGNNQNIKKYTRFNSAKKAPSYTPKTGESASKQQLAQLKQWPKLAKKTASKKQVITGLGNK